MLLLNVYRPDLPPRERPSRVLPRWADLEASTPKPRHNETIDLRAVGDGRDDEKEMSGDGETQAPIHCQRRSGVVFPTLSCR